MNHQPTVISAGSLPEAWEQIVTTLRSRVDGALPNLIVHVESPTRELPGAFSHSSEFVNDWADELQSAEPQRLPFTHGERIKRWLIQTIGGKYSFLDQINDFVVPMLVRNPHTKRAFLQIADPSQDAVVTDEPIPALQLIQFALEDTKLHCTAYYRAQEMYMFWLVNMFELISLQESICGRIAERAPQMHPTPSSITTYAFLGYANPTDLLGQDSTSSSSTLAIERLEVSKIKSRDLDALLEEAFITRDLGALNKLNQLLGVDLQKLDRIRDVDYWALDRLQSFLSEHFLSDMPELAGLSRKLLSEVVALDIDLERGRSLQELNASLTRARSTWQELLSSFELLLKGS